MAISQSFLLTCILQEFDGKKSSAFEKEGFALSFQVVKSIFGNPWYAALGREEVGPRDVVSQWLKYSLETGKMFT